MNDERISRAKARRVRALTTLLVAIIGLGVLAPSSSTALWSSSASPAPVTLTAGVVPMPTISACTNQYSGLLNAFVAAKMDWSPVTDAVSYRVTFTSGNNSTVTTVSNPTVTVNSGILGTLWGVLTGGAYLYATVQAEHSGGWRSEPSSPQRLVRSVLPLGIECA